MPKMIYTSYQTNSFKIIKSMFYINELPHTPVIFLINLGIFNCFENSDKTENFRQTVPIYGLPPPAPPEFPPLASQCQLLLVFENRRKSFNSFLNYCIKDVGRSTAMSDG